MKNTRLHIEPAIWAIIIIGLLSMGILFYINLSWQASIQNNPILINSIKAEFEKQEWLHLYILILLAIIISGTFIVLLINSHKRRVIEISLKESEGKLKSILNNTTTVIYVKDINGRYTFINKQFENLIKVTCAEVEGKTDYDLWPKEIADSFRANDMKVMESKTPLEFEEIAPQEDGLHSYIAIKFPLYNSAGAIYAVCGISTDITKRKQMEEIIRQMAYHDTLTSLPNRKLFEERLTMAIAHSIRNNEHLSIMYLDLDGFKLINDTFVSG